MKDIINDFVKSHSPIKKKEAKHAALMKRMHKNYGKGRELTKEERNPKLKRVHSKDDKFLGE